MTIEATWAVIADVNRRGGIKSHDSPHGTHHPCEHCDDLRAALIAVLDEAVAGARYTPTSKAAWIVALRRRIETLGAALAKAGQQ